MKHFVKDCMESSCGHMEAYIADLSGTGYETVAIKSSGYFDAKEAREFAAILIKLAHSIEQASNPEGQNA